MIILSLPNRMHRLKTSRNPLCQYKFSTTKRKSQGQESQFHAGVFVGTTPKTNAEVHSQDAISNKRLITVLVGVKLYYVKR